MVRELADDGSDPGVLAGLNKPTFLICDERGLWVNEDSTHGARLLLIDKAGRQQTILSFLKAPQSIVQTGDGTYLFAEGGRNRVLELVGKPLAVASDDRLRKRPRNDYWQVPPLWCDPVPPTGCVPLGHAAANIGVTIKTTSNPTNDSFFITSSVTIAMSSGIKISRIHERWHTLITRNPRNLSEPSIQIDEIACLLGYEDTNSSYRAFRTWEGTTPARWRASQSASTH